jgi:hypothetical protein
MSVYKSYKSGTNVKTLAKNWGVRRTYNSLRRKLKGSQLRIKHNRIQLLNKRGSWDYLT